MPSEALAKALARLEAELADLEARLEEERKALEALSPLPVYWRWAKCGKERCRKCPHGRYRALLRRREALLERLAEAERALS